MALGFLVDTSVLQRLSRSEVREAAEPLAVSGRLGRPRIGDLEASYSAPNAVEWDRIVGALDAFALHLRRRYSVPLSCAAGVLCADTPTRSTRTHTEPLVAARSQHEQAPPGRWAAPSAFYVQTR